MDEILDAIDSAEVHLSDAYEILDSVSKLDERVADVMESIVSALDELQVIKGNLE